MVLGEVGGLDPPSPPCRSSAPHAATATAVLACLENILVWSLYHFICFLVWRMLELHSFVDGESTVELQCLIPNGIFQKNNILPGSVNSALRNEHASVP